MPSSLSVTKRCFIRPKNEQIVSGAFFFWPVETTQNVGVKKYFKERVYVASFHLILLRHRHAYNFSAINFLEVEAVLVVAKHLDDIGCQKELEIISDGPQPTYSM